MFPYCDPTETEKLMDEMKLHVNYLTGKAVARTALLQIDLTDAIDIRLNMRNGGEFRIKPSGDDGISIHVDGQMAVKPEASNAVILENLDWTGRKF
jgi:hypothetical protein